MLRILPVKPLGGNQNYLVTNLEAALRDQHARVRADLEAGHANSLQKMADEKALLLEQGRSSEPTNECCREVKAASKLTLSLINTKLGCVRSLAEQEAHWQKIVAEKELALHYAQDKQLQLRDELQSLEQALPTQNAKAIQSFLQQLLAQGVELIVSEKRLGSHGLKLDQIYQYLENRDAFWAAQNGISEAHYKAWRLHHVRPVCQAGSSTGCECGAAVRLVDHPRNFVLGESDMCHAHRLKKGRRVLLTDRIVQL